MGERCDWAIKWGVTYHTRCMRDAHDVPTDGAHTARGLAEFPYQLITWYAGDRREYQTDREDEHSWEET